MKLPHPGQGCGALGNLSKLSSLASCFRSVCLLPLCPDCGFVYQIEMTKTREASSASSFNGNNILSTPLDFSTEECLLNSIVRVSHTNTRTWDIRRISLGYFQGTELTQELKMFVKLI